MRPLKRLTLWTLLAALVLAFLLTPAFGYIQGDMNDDKDVTLSDAVLIMRFLSKTSLSKPLQKEVGVGSDQKIGLDDFIYVLQVVSGLRSRNSSPTASFSLLSDDTGDAPFLVEFDASGSLDSEGSIVGYLWAFGDGESASSPVPEMSHVYSTPGTYQAVLTVLDGGGARGVFTKWIAVKGQTEPPPDPATVAPALDTTVPTHIKTSTEFLYTGVNPIQEGVIPDKIERERAAVLRGKVTERDGSALSGVRITVLGHPEFGQTLTREDGLFDLAVNGGGYITLNYKKEGYLSLQRQMSVGWQEWAWAPDVVMIPQDTVATVVDFSAPVQAAQSSVVTDERGERQSTLLFREGTAVEAVLPDGTVQSLPAITVRSTEYTIGDTGPKAMPAELPPGVAYTWAAELTVDEAVGAETVRFNKPVPHYVENFLGFPVGDTVPAYYYDRDQGVWVPMSGGRVIKILRVTEGLAEVDADGDGQAEDVNALEALGIDDAERGQLAGLYTPGTSLWRVALTHFTPVDYNWPPNLPEDATPPTPPSPPTVRRDETDPCEASGSIVDCQNRVLGQRIPVTGTSFTLNYRSSRVPGNLSAYTVEIPLTGETPPLSLVDVRVVVDVAGQHKVETLDRAPNLTYRYTWDGKDAYGRPVQGNQSVKVRIGYTYIGSYDCFGGGCPGNVPQTLWTEWEGEIPAWESLVEELGGWSLSPRHFYNPKTRDLVLGTGERQVADWKGSVIDTFLQVRGYFEGIDAAPDGSLYVALADGGVVQRVASDGSVSIFAGSGGGFSGDGGPATAAGLSEPVSVAVAPDGSVLIADRANHRIRKVTTDGIISTVAGSGETGYTAGGYAGDGGPATEALLRLPRAVAVAPDGSFFIADSYNERVRRVDPAGIITTVAGGGTVWPPSGNKATEVRLIHPWSVAVGPDGRVYIHDGDTVGSSEVYRIEFDGKIQKIAGKYENASWPGDGGPATNAWLSPGHIDVAPDGGLYIADSDDHRVRYVDPKGIITTIAGKGYNAYYNYGGFSGDGGPSTNAELNTPRGVCLSPEGSVYIADSYNFRIRRVGPALPSLGQGVILVPSEDASEAYVFTPEGKHQSTIDLLTGTTLFIFRYDTNGRLAGIEDGDGNLTVVERDGKGNPVAIVSPYGERTVLSQDAGGYLSGITNPAGETRSFTYTAGGLMTEAVDPGGNASVYSYDLEGNLSRAENPAGGYQDLARTQVAGGYKVSRTTAMGRSTTYQVENLSTGDTRWLNTKPCGKAVETILKPDGTQITTGPEGMTMTLRKGPDPRFGMQSPVTTSMTIGTPGGLTYTLAGERTATLDNPIDPLSLSLLTDRQTINGRAFRRVYDGAAGTVTRTTPLGRIRTATLDAQGRVLQKALSGIEPVAFGYDDLGRLDAVSQGAGADTRTLTFGYGAEGSLLSMTDAMNRSTAFDYDGAGRLSSLTLPDGGAVQMTYDTGGNMTGIIPPGRPVHQFVYTQTNRLAQYVPPSAGSEPAATTYGYNQDGQLTQVQRPDGQVLAFDYDPAGRLSSVTQPRGVLTYTYDANTGNVSSITAPGGETLAFVYDGFLRTQSAWSGVVNGTVEVTYDSNFRIVSRTINGADPVSFTHDNDGLMTGAGSLILSRNGSNGFLNGTTLGGVTESIVYSAFGERTGCVTMHNGSPVLDIQYTRDKLGRIVEKRETIGGVTSVYGYTYDAAGRLTGVLRDGTPEESYTYDGNGNRLTANGFSSTYDSQDRLSQAGTTTYTYTANGELVTKVEGGQSTTFSYDLMGNLTNVSFPDGTGIEYVIDGYNRRIGKKRNGILAQGFLYKDRLNVAAELDGEGSVVSRFVYASKRNVPDYMVRQGVTYRIVSDHLGSVRLVVNAEDGSVAQRMDYDAFGRVLLDTSPGFQPFGFAGGLYDPDTGLTRFGARDYDADAGRWTSKDPIGFMGGDTNLYAYVLNDPVNFVDLPGLATRAPFPGAPLDPSIPGVIATESTDFVMGAAGVDVPVMGTGIGRGLGEMLHDWINDPSDYTVQAGEFADWAEAWNDDYERQIRELQQLLRPCP